MRVWVLYEPLRRSERESDCTALFFCSHDGNRRNGSGAQVSYGGVASSAILQAHYGTRAATVRGLASRERSREQHWMPLTDQFEKVVGAPTRQVRKSDRRTARELQAVESGLYQIAGWKTLEGYKAGQLGPPVPPSLTGRD